MQIRVRDLQLLLTAPGALCVLDLDRKERGKKHASEFQSERNDHNLALCNVNKLHSQGDRVLKRHHGEPVRPRRGRWKRVHFRRCTADLMLLFPASVQLAVGQINRRSPPLPFSTPTGISHPFIGRRGDMIRCVWNQLELRLGGIYVLERSAQESGKDHWPIHGSSDHKCSRTRSYKKDNKDKKD